jgi:hypothetical protein
MWFVSAHQAPSKALLGTKTASDLRKRKCDPGHADPI